MFSKAPSTCPRQQHPLKKKKKKKHFQYRGKNRTGYGEKQEPWGFKRDKEKDSQDSKGGGETLSTFPRLSLIKENMKKRKRSLEVGAEGLVNRSEK